MPDPLVRVRSRILVLPQPNIDTDRIIPARFLTTVAREGIGRYLFADWRGHGSALDDPRAAGCAILVAGDNFGCGSSREHAAWALADFGIRVVISTRIADIFRANALKNGILAFEVDAATHARLSAAPWADVEVDLPARTLRLPDGSVAGFEVDGFGARCLEEGLDELDYLCTRIPAIEHFEEASR